jgi:hypothetical protein
MVKRHQYGREKNNYKIESNRERKSVNLHLQLLPLSVVHSTDGHSNCENREAISTCFSTEAKIIMPEVTL